MKHPSLGLIMLLLVSPLAAQKTENVPPPFEKKTETHGKETDSFDSLDDDAPKLVRVQVEFVEMAHTKLTVLLMEETPKTADATALRRKTQELVEKGEATVLETMIATGRSGQKVTSESIHEFIYPTEFDAGGFPYLSEARAEEKIQKTLDENLARGFPFNPVTPTAFETRNLGSTLEIEPTVGYGDKIVDLRFVPEIVWHTGNTLWGEIKDANGNVQKFQVPDFYVIRLNTAIITIAGQYQFVSALSPKNAEGNTDTTRKVMVFVKCDILSVK